MGARDGARGRRGGLRRPGADGPPDPDPPGRLGLAADPGALGHPRPRRRSGHPARAGHAVHAGHVPSGRRDGQGSGHARRALAAAAPSSASAPGGGSASTRRTDCRSPLPATGWTCSRRRSRRAGPSGRPAPRRTPANACDSPRPPPTRARPTTSRWWSEAAASGGPWRSQPGSATPATSRRTPRRFPTEVAVLDRHLAAAGRTRDDVAVTVLDLPVVGSRPRGRLGAGRAAPRAYAGRGLRPAYPRRDGRRAPPRYDELRALGVGTVFVGVRGLESADGVRALAGLAG